LEPLTPSLCIAALWLAFTATHLGLASVRVEPGLRARLGDGGFLGLYSFVAALILVPLVWIYFGNRHTGGWLWFVPVTPALRALLYLAMGAALLLIASGLLVPSPASLAGTAGAEVRGALRITRHPLVLGIALLAALHLIPNGAAADLAFFGGAALFSACGAWHQDQRKLAYAAPGFAAFHAATPFWPSARGALRGLRELPARVWLASAAAFLAIRWLHGSLWPHP